MKFKATLSIFAAGDVVQRNPKFWDKVKRAFGGHPNLDTDRLKTRLQAAELIMGGKRALERLGVDNAVALVIDGQVLFEDKKGAAHDAGDLFLAFFENEDVFGREWKDLRLVVEHREAGLHYMIEMVGAGEHEKKKPTVLVHVGGRVSDLEPKAGEDADAFRKRVEPLLATPALAETSRLQFEAFAARVQEALGAALAGVRVAADDARSIVEKPGHRKGGRTQREPTPQDPQYDPHERWAPSPLGDVASMIFWTSMMSWAWHPTYVVVDSAGHEVGTTDDLSAASGDGTSDGGGMDDGAADTTDFDTGDSGDFGGGDW